MRTQWSSLKIVCNEKSCTKLSQTELEIFFSLPCTINNFLIASLKLHTNFETVTETLLVDLSLAAGESFARITCHRRLPE
jgi:hypothetical protein